MRFGTMLLCTTLIAAMPLAVAAENHPDCEPGQAWIGYNPNTAAVGAFIANNAPGNLKVCEGEHWDGQDSINGQTAGGAETQPADCDGALQSNPDDLHANRCMASDPNQMPGNDPTNPLGFRVSKRGDASYAALNIADVGRVVVYVDDDTAAVYLRDNTVTNGENVLAQIVSAPGITRGNPGEADCSQQTYREGAEAPANSPDSRKCTRDNTAITVHHTLLA